MNKNDYIIVLQADHIKRLEEDNKKLKQTLSKIKEMIKNYCNCCRQFEPNKICHYCMYNKIHKKVKEVLND